MYQYKKESTIILACIIIIILFYLICWVFKKLNKIELFSHGDSKREMMKKIYKSDDISDPDEITSVNAYYDNVHDPDDSYGMDPDEITNHYNHNHNYNSNLNPYYYNSNCTNDIYDMNPDE